MTSPECHPLVTQASKTSTKNQLPHKMSLTSEPLVQWSIGVVDNHRIEKINVLQVLDIRQVLRLRPRLQAQLGLGPGSHQ